MAGNHYSLVSQLHLELSAAVFYRNCWIERKQVREMAFIASNLVLHILGVYMCIFMVCITVADLGNKKGRI